MVPFPPRRPPPPPLWLPLLVAVPLTGCLLLLAWPSLGHGDATLTRALYVPAFLVWLLPLTLLQRALWQRGLSAWTLAAILLPATYLMALVTRLGVAAWLASRTDAPARHLADVLAGTMPLRGLEGTWLALLAYCAAHVVIAYYAALRHEQAQHLQSRLLARDAELRALRYQLQPHFLFNALNAVSALVAEHRGAEARRMLSRLGEFLRAVLDAPAGHEVALAEEIAMTEAYVDVEQARLGDRLRLTWRLGDGLLGARVPGLLLQPLVENAIRHGISPSVAPGRLDITGNAEQGRLRLTVVNDLAAGATPHAAEGRDAVGLRNVRDRLMHLYGDAATLDAGLRDDGRYHVVLVLPLRQGAVEGGAP